LQEALPDCNEALKLKPNYIHALDSRGFVQLRMGQYEAAIADYDAALKLEPNKVASLYGRGMARRRKGDYAAGNADIAAARAIEPDVTAQFLRYGLQPPLIDLLPLPADGTPEQDRAPLARSRRNN
jgi:tetratricopeptide (TPR) repeat protein